jgi:hypothetical protein
MLDRCRGEDRAYNMVCRILCRGLVIEWVMWTFGVVFFSILLAKNSCFEYVTEDFSAEKFVPESAIETLAITVFPG